MNEPSDIGVIGLAVMGENLILNIASRGYHVAVYNRTVAKVDAFLSGRANGKTVVGVHDPAALVRALKTPRRILLMVKAGPPVDDLIGNLVPYLQEGDILIDGGNSHFADTRRRTAALGRKGILYVGAGISGGEEGALHGPSIMPGGNAAAWPHLREILQSIAARVDGDPCCEWIGDDGAGHFVKMVHNGIEYGDMQLICEAYHVMSSLLGLSADAMADIFAEWNRGDLNSYLIEITSNILRVKDESSGKRVIDLIVDRAGQKGTGKWTSVTGLDLGVPIPQIAEAVFARCISAVRSERQLAATQLVGPTPGSSYDTVAVTAMLRDAVYAAKICSYAQGFQLLAAAATEYKWQINYGMVAQTWREGCIIRAAFLRNIKEAFDRDPQLVNLLLDPFFSDVLARAQNSWRGMVKLAVDAGIPLPSITSALAYYDAYRCARLPANLLQAQRDYFGAHTYERLDKPAGQFFHTDWTGRGGHTSSTSYNA